MPRADPLPDALRQRPFTRAQVLEGGLTRRALQGRRFRVLLRGVYVCSDVPLDLGVGVRAALLILPADAVVTGLTGLHVRGVRVGPAWGPTFTPEWVALFETRSAARRAAQTVSATSWG